MTQLDGSVRKTEDGGFIVAFDRLTDRPPARVWAALTDPKILANWLGDVELDLRIGGPFIIRFRRMSVVMTGQITALDPGRMLEYTTRFQPQPTGSSSSTPTKKPSTLITAPGT
ncbi:MAG: Activator of Hsp90 ATPase 1 family protein [Gammaproteobacteria bacterium]|nr:Activator of Hsp90 ATPase 1 family protein [Gammaproteobacteria bacterium]